MLILMSLAKIGRCSSAVEQRFCKPLVGGSNPFTGLVRVDVRVAKGGGL